MTPTRGRRGLARFAGAAASCALALGAIVGVGGVSFADRAHAAGCGGFENPCSSETAQQFGYYRFHEDSRCFAKAL